MPEIIIPHWPAPNSVRACSTLRADNFDCRLKEQQQRLITIAHLPSNPAWLDQVHGNTVVLAEAAMFASEPVQADAVYTQQNGIVCAVLTADCVPILLANKIGTEVAAIHGGWRGLAADVIGNTCRALQSKPHELMAWIGPAISVDHYEIGGEVRDVFLAQYGAEVCDKVFHAQPGNNNKWRADLPLLAKYSLLRAGILSQDIYLSGECTYKNADRYFSYRRDNGETGRMASLICLQAML